MDSTEKIEQQLVEQQEINNQIIRQLILNMDRMNQIETELLYVKMRNENLKYEILGSLNIETDYFFPQFRDIQDTIEDIIDNKKSLARFGDGDFGILFCREREGIKFQSLNEKLSNRLREVLHSNHPKLLVGIADNYGSLEKYTDLAADGIRSYMTTSGIRKAHEDVLERNRIYENAYISRPYVMYRDNQTEAPRERFDDLRRIWKDREVVIIEGSQTRMGVGNDLLEGAKNIRRILAPATNAFDKYDDILNAALEFAQKDTLFLIVLGAAAEVLAYDLTIAGYQAIDIGQVDIEYEWFLKGKGERIEVPYKYNNEVDGGENVEEFHDEAYESQILRVIS